MGLIGTPQLAPGGASGSIDLNYYRKYTRRLLCWATTDFDEHNVLTNLGIGIYTIHPSDTGSYCTGIEVGNPRKCYYDSANNPGGAATIPAPGTSCYQWDASVEYGPWNPLLAPTNGDPTTQPYEIKMNGVNYEKIADLDNAGNPILNSAGDYFDPPVTMDQTRCVLEVTRNETGFSPSTIFAYANKVNLASWNGFPANSVKIAPPQIVPMWSQFSNELYSRVTYTFEFEPDTWVKKVLNQGYRQLVTSGSTTTQKNILDNQGVPITSPALLNSSGQVLAQPVTSSNIVVLSFDVYDTLDFTVLNMNDLFTY